MPNWNANKDCSITKEEEIRTESSYRSYHRHRHRHRHHHPFLKKQTLFAIIIIIIYLLPNVLANKKNRTSNKKEIVLQNHWNRLEYETHTHTYILNYLLFEMVNVFINVWPTIVYTGSH